MSVIVQKFGGTSVADTEKIAAAARKAIRAHQEGHQVIVVVSAMGKNTDQLIALAHELTQDPPAREMDMLLSTGEQVSVALMAMAVHSLGHKAISLTGGQVGITTDSTHTKARIRSISTDRLRRALETGHIVIVAGFQGIDEELNITTLGRGGSDTTAVAIAAVLNAQACEIFTDVDGVYTTDPRLLPEARKVDTISYDEMLELASLGAGVLHNRSVEFAKKFSVPLHVRSSFSDVLGTIVTDESSIQPDPVSGAALVEREARITVEEVPDLPGTNLLLFSRIAQENIPVDMIVQSEGSEGKASISFTVPEADLPRAILVTENVAHTLGASAVSHDGQVAKLSVVGWGMSEATGVAEQMFQALADAKINIHMITTSEIKISVLINRQQARAALRSVHQVFQLHQPSKDRSTSDKVIEREITQIDPVDVVDYLRNMEDLTVHAVSLDCTQGRLTIHGVPDIPGWAAQVFQSLAREKVFIDMIVQGAGHAGRADLSLTVRREDVSRAEEVIRSLLVQSEDKPELNAVAKIAKLSVSGIGMRSHTEVAIRIFQALARHKINIEMVNTSEFRMNVVISDKEGTEALQALQEEFKQIATAEPSH
ncbi:Aspartate kinase, monofunctional class [Planctomycetales bacterium 10988]|nr:Aspartate kinase, monofunctional class [Planctomycetales bacterium 10988]